MRAFASLLGAVIFAGGAAYAGPAPERPAFPEISLLDAQGRVTSLKSSLGRATVLNFWATWCGPCRIELPELQQLYNELAGKGAAVLAINVDSPREHVGPFMKRNNLSLPVFFLDAETETSLGIRSLPTTVLLDREGRVVKVYAGYSKEEMRDLWEQAESLLAPTRGQGGK